MKRNKNTIVIDRSKWICGQPPGMEDMNIPIGNRHGEGKTMLLNKEGYMCCLGFATHQISRCKKSDLLEVDDPSSYYSWEYDGHPYRLQDIEHEAVGVNDDPGLTRKEREEELKRIFKSGGFKLKFKGKYKN